MVAAVARVLVVVLVAWVAMVPIGASVAVEGAAQGTSGVVADSAAAHGVLDVAAISAPSPGSSVSVAGGVQPLDLCPAAGAVDTGFGDVAGSTHRQAIECLVWAEITQGIAPGVFDPSGAVTRGQMASFLVRMLAAHGVELEAVPLAFGDVEPDAAHADAIARLVGAGITQGVDAQRFAPGVVVTRGQMASFLTRTVELVVESELPADGSGFDDIATSTHREAISKAAAVGLTGGVSADRFAPGAEVRRDQMASFLARTLSYLAVNDPDADQPPTDDADEGSGPDDGEDPGDTEEPGGVDQWTRVAHDEAVFGGDDRQLMWSVTAGGPGLVAVGRDGGQDAAAVWTSTDGLDWQRVAHDEAVFGGDGSQAMSSVTAGGPGLVAVGSDFEQGAAAVWTSADGLVWERVAHDEAVFAGDDLDSLPEMSSVTAGGPGLVAVGSERGRQAAVVWTSSDGLDWQRVAHDEAVFGGDDRQAMLSVTAGGPGLVAVGRDGNRGAVWTSTDGLDWQRVAHDEAVFGGDGLQEMWSVTAGGPGLVAVGNDRGFDDFGALVSEAAAVWTSADGLDWQRVAHDEAVFGGDGRQSMQSVTAGGPGLVAVGNDRGFDDFGELVSEAAAVWTSSDGLDWQRVAHDEAVFGGDGEQVMRSVTAGGPGLVAVGNDGDLEQGSAAVWTSP